MRIKILAFILLVPLFVNVAYTQMNSATVMDIILENCPYPFPVQFMQPNIQQQQLQMAYVDARPANPGAYWRSTAKALSEQGYRVLIPDQVGFGKSSKHQPNCPVLLIIGQGDRTASGKEDVLDAVANL